MAAVAQSTPEGMSMMGVKNTFIEIECPTNPMELGRSHSVPTDPGAYCVDKEELESILDIESRLTEQVPAARGQDNDDLRQQVAEDSDFDEDDLNVGMGFSRQTTIDRFPTTPKLMCRQFTNEEFETSMPMYRQFTNEEFEIDMAKFRQRMGAPTMAPSSGPALVPPAARPVDKAEAPKVVEPSLAQPAQKWYLGGMLVEYDRAVTLVGGKEEGAVQPGAAQKAELRLKATVKDPPPLPAGARLAPASLGAEAARLALAQAKSIQHGRLGLNALNLEAARPRSQEEGGPQPHASPGPARSLAQTPQSVELTFSPDGAGGFVQACWTVDSRKLTSNDMQAVSPPFDLFPGCAFRIILFPTRISKGKGGASFRKAQGRGLVQLKCEAVFPVSKSCNLRAALGSDAFRGPTVTHDFSQRQVCCLPAPAVQGDWDFGGAVNLGTQSFRVRVEVTP